MQCFNNLSRCRCE